jgi:hypothetical protein
MDRFLILADVAPHSHAYRHYKAIVQGWAKSGVLDVSWRDRFDITIDQVKDKLEIHQFHPRRFTGLSDASAEQIKEVNERYSIPERVVGGAWEVLTHDVLQGVAKVTPLVGPILGDKLAPIRSPIESYRKWELYGEDFADWREPWKGFIRPKLHELTASTPMTAAAGGAMMGVFGSNPLARLFLGTAGAVGLGAASTARMLSSGRITAGYIPEHRVEERRMGEYLDYLEYVKARRLQKQAATIGDQDLVREYRRQAQGTVAGLDYSLPLQYFRNQARAALPRRERAYFDAFLAIDSTRGREEVMRMVPDYVKPIYQAAWTKMGNPEASIEAKYLQRSSDQRAADYFRGRPLPDGDWAGWHPSVPMSVVKVKAIDSAASSTALDKHRFNLWLPQEELAYRDFPELDVPVIDVTRLHRPTMDRHAFMDELHRQGGEVPPGAWEGSLSAETISWETISDQTRRAMQYAGAILR